MSRRTRVGVGAAALLLAVAATAAAAVPEEDAVEAYVAAHATVRQAQADLEAARLDYERATKVAAAPALAVSGAAGSRQRTDLSGGSGAGASKSTQSSVANGGLTLTWSPVVPLSLQARLRYGVGLTEQDIGQPTSSASTLVFSQQTAAVSLQASLALWPPPSLQSRSLDAESARLRLQKAEHALRNATEEARLEGHRLYVQVQVAAARLSVAQQRLSLAERALARALDQRRLGLLGEDGVLEARSAAQKAALTVQQATMSLVGLEQQLRLPASRIEPLPRGDDLAALARRASEEALRRLAQAPRGLALPPLGDPSGEAGGVVTGLPPLPESVVRAVVDGAFEVRQVRQEAELARRRLEAVRRSRGSATLSAQTTSVSTGSSPATDWSVQLTAGWDLFDGGKRRLDEDQAASALAEAERAVEDARRQVSQELQTRWQELATAVLQLFAARADLDVAEGQLRSASSRHERGVASADSVTQAELGRADAALSLLEAARSLEIAWQRWLERVQPADGPLS